MIEMTVFLGNPGNRYERTRHNTGRMLLSELGETRGILWREKFNGSIAEWNFGGRKIRLLVPGTYMNDSGKSVSAAMRFHKLQPAQILVVHDDIELPFGTYAWRFDGGLAGHNGLRSIKTHLGTAAFWRLRLGVGRPSRGSVQSWVLGRFDPAEEAALPGILGAAAADLKTGLSGENAVQNGEKPVRVYE